MVDPALLASRRCAGAIAVLAVGAAVVLGGCGRPAAAPIDRAAPSEPVVLGVYVGATPARFDAPAYFVLDQRGGDDEIVSITVETVDRVILMSADVGMDPITGAAVEPAEGVAADGFPLALAAGSRTVVAPGRDHVMLHGLSRDLVPGESLDVRFSFDRHDGVVVARAQVVQPADLLEIDLLWEETR